MSVEIAWKQNILVTDFHLLKSLLVVLGFGSQAFVCGFSRQNINSVLEKISKFSLRYTLHNVKLIGIFSNFMAFSEHLNLKYRISANSFRP